MGRKANLQPSSDAWHWKQIYGAMKEMLLSQQLQIKTLITEREFLENYVGIQHEQWSAKEQLLKSHIEQMKKEQSKTCLIETTKLDVLVGAKECEAHLYKLHFELAESDLEDIRSCIESLATGTENLKETTEVAAVDNVKRIVDASSSSPIFEGGGESSMHVKMEIRKLKHAYKKLSSRRDTEVAALLAEKDFAWNQFRKMESECLGLVKCKNNEVNQAKLVAEKLQGNVEKLLLSLNEKEEIITKLEAERAMLWSDLIKHTEEVENANNNLKRLRLDMDELHLIALEKDKIVSSLREELCMLKTDLKRSNLESSSSLDKKEFEELTATKQKIYLQKCSTIGMVGSSGSNTTQNHRAASRVTFKTSASEDVHKDEVVVNLSEELSEFKKSPKVGLEEFCSSKQKESKVKSNTGSTTKQQIIMQKYSVKDKQNSCSNTSQQRRTSRIALQAKGSADVHVSSKESRSTLSSPGKRLLFHSDFKIPKLRNTRLRTS